MDTTLNTGIPTTFFFGQLVIVGLLGLFTIFWIWTIIDCVSKEPSEGNDKLIWILIIIFTGWIGSLIYCIIRRPSRKKLYGK